MPAADGTAGQVVCTNGSDTLTFGPGGYWTCVAGPELYYTGGNVGIGTADPSHTLDVEGVANFLTCTVTPDVCGTTKVIGQLVCSATNVKADTDLCAVADVHAGVCIVTPQVCGTTQVTGAIVCASTELRGALICSAGGNVCSCIVTATDHASACMRSCHYCALGTIGAPEMQVSLAPTATGHVTPKCYVDAQITANAKGVCCTQTALVTSYDATADGSASITQVPASTSFVTISVAQCGEVGTGMYTGWTGYIACNGCCVYGCSLANKDCTVLARYQVVAAYA
jgi:hypothetical protein